MAQTEEFKPSCRLVFEMHKNGKTQALRYAASNPLDKKDILVTTLLIFVHGIYRDAQAYCDRKDYDIIPDTGHNGDKIINSGAAKKWIYGK